MENEESPKKGFLRDERVRLIAQNGMVAALYYALTMLFILVPVISQFGPMQCRFSEILVLLAFFCPKLIPGLTLGCLLANFTGFMVGQGFAFDMLLGTGATLIACLLEAYASKFLLIAALWPVIANGIIVGAEVYWFFNQTALPIYVCMGWVALGELIVMAIGYVLFLFLKRNKGFMDIIGASLHREVRF